jgi:DNA polymerase-1
MRTFVLIDGNAMIHRAYHAMPALTNADGKTVNAVYGFFAMLLNILGDIKPEYLVVCFDRSKPTIRQSMYAGYHAHRPKMADDLHEQIEVLDRLLETLKVRTYALDGFEGDDLIGTLATKIPQELPDAEVIIVTGDRDLLQLVNDNVRVLMPITGLTKTALFNAKAVEEKYGVHPRQFIDYKALIGDASDGYPGVAGIGPKTASQLLQQYQTFENLYEHLSELPEKYGVKLATDAEQAALAKKLATIITDAPIHLDITKCTVAGFDLPALKEEFEKLGFKSLISRIDSRYPELAKPKKKDVPDGQMGLL